MRKKPAQRVDELLPPSGEQGTDPATPLKQAHEARHALQQFASASLDALSAHLAILDKNGTIIAVNRAWRAFAQANAGVTGTANLCEGANYLAVCDTVHDVNSLDAAAFAAGIRSVLQGGQDEFTLEYACHSPNEKRWFIGKVTCFIDIGGPYLVIIHENITPRKQAEEAQQHLVENLSRQAEDMDAFLRLSRSLRAAQNYQEVLPILVTISGEILQAGTGALLILENNIFQLSTAFGTWQSFLNTTYPMNLGDWWEFIRIGTPQFIEQTGSARLGEADQISASLIPSAASCIIIPLKARQSPIGLLILGYDVVQAFSENLTRLAQMISEIASNTLHRTRLMARMEKMVANRTWDLGVLYEVLSAANEIFEIKEALKNALGTLLKATASQSGAFYLFNQQKGRLELSVQHGLSDESLEFLEKAPPNDTLEEWIRANNLPLLIQDMALDKRVFQTEAVRNETLAYLGVPMRNKGMVVGVLFVIRAVTAYNLDEISLLESVGDHIALIVENAHLHQIAESAALVEERSRLGRDLHDSATQLLYSAELYADASLALVRQEKYAALETQLERLSDIIHQSLKEMRLLVFQLRPSTLEHEGLAAALQRRLASVESRVGVETQLAICADATLPAPVEEEFFWIASEALNNIIRHARASKIRVAVDVENDQILLSIADNGLGFDPASLPTCGLGLESMRKRVEKLDGKFEILSQPGKGTTVNARVPARSQTLGEG